MSIAKTTEYTPRPAEAHELHSGCRITLHGTERLVWRVEYRPRSQMFKIHTVPPKGENPDYYAYSLTPSQTVELISTGPAVDAFGHPATTTYYPPPAAGTSNGPADHGPRTPTPPALPPKQGLGERASTA